MEFTVRKNRLKERNAQGLASSMVLLDILEPGIVELFAMAGYDVVMLEGEHHAINEQAYISIIRTAELYGMTPTIRLRSPDAGLIGRLLDIGIQGITKTHVHSADELQQLIRFAKYPPEGQRGFGYYGRANWWGQIDEAEAYENANNEIMLVGLVEDAEGLEHLDEILAVPGIDSIGVGASDLSAALGHAGQYDHPEVRAAFAKVKEAMARVGRDWTVPAPQPPPYPHIPEKGHYPQIASSVIVRLLRENKRVR